MPFLDGKPVIITKRNVDKFNNPISVRQVETKQVVDIHNSIPLNYSIDRNHPIVIKDLHQIYNKDEISENTFWADYDQGILYFHPKLVGKPLTITYMGTGYILISSDRIYRYNKGDGTSATESIEASLEKLENILNTITQGGNIAGNIEIEVIGSRTDAQGQTFSSLGDRLNYITTQLDNLRTINASNVILDSPLFGGATNAQEAFVQIDIIYKEVIDARVKADGTQYNTLGERLNKADADFDLLNKEVIDARVKADGTQYNTLGERLNKADADFDLLNKEVIDARTDKAGTTHKDLKTRLDNVDSQLDTIVRNQKIYVKDFGYVGDGVYDDAIAIQKAIDYANTLISRSSDVYEFLWNGCPTIVLPETPCYVKSGVISKNALCIEGYNTNSQIVVNSDLEYVIKFTNDITSVTKNEEGQVVGTVLNNFRINGNKRRFNVSYAVLLEKQDNLIIDNISFYAVKGECIRFATVRESKFDNIYTRFCGNTNTPNLNFIYNAGDETNNLNFGDTWSIVFPFGQAIKLNNTDIQGVKNVMLHGMFDTIINKLTTYFGVNSYDPTGHNFIELYKSSINIDRLLTTYCPSGKADLKLFESKCQLTNSRFTGHYGTMSTTSNDNFIYCESNSTCWIGDNVLFDSGATDMNIFRSDSTCKIYGSPIKNIDGRSGSYLNADTTAYIRGKNIQLAGELATNLNIKMQDYYNSKTINGVGMIPNIFTITKHPQMTTSDGELLYMGYTEYGNHPLVGIPNETVFTIPSINSASESNLPSKAIFFDEVGNLKIRKGGKTYIVTVTPTP